MSETLANKIAAGEVVQRPASAAKELIENAIDAGADDVSVILKSAGSELIQVVDNGCGMGPEDALHCFKRHATSKIQSIEDLEHIQTLGFRGEALASISAVAQVELKTRRVQDEAGFLVRMHGGTLLDTEPCATPNGTSVAVRNLFYNVPARRNFLKSPATEFKHLVETFQFLALANPTVAFTLVHDDNVVYRLNKSRSDDFFEALLQRVEELLGSEHARKCVPVEETTSYLSAIGFVGDPTFHRRSRGDQFLFVNGRYVKNRSLDHAIVHAYEGLLPEGGYPFYTLFLQLDPRHVDVNVHPTKAEIKFDDERGVYGFVKAVVKKALGSASLTPLLNHDVPEREDGTSPGTPTLKTSTPTFAPMTPLRPTHQAGSRNQASEGRQDHDGSMQRGEATPRYGQGSLGGLSDALYRPDAIEDTEHTIASGSMKQERDQPERTTGEPLLWQLHNRYVLTQIHSGLMILDQQAAHERILYERALQSMKSGFGMSQQLLFPHTLEFSPSDFELLQELLENLRALGFDLEVFSGRSVVVRGVPTDIRPGDERQILDDILNQYKSYQSDFQIKGRDNLAKSIARRSATPSGVKMTVKEMRTLVDQLFMCEMPYASPHGHPTIIKISIEELDKRFGRSGS